MLINHSDPVFRWCTTLNPPQTPYFFSVNGGFGEWSKFGLCSKSCGNGVRMRHRECNKPVPRYGGTGCDPKDLFQTKACSNIKCPAKTLKSECKRSLTFNLKTEWLTKAVAGTKFPWHILQEWDNISSMVKFYQVTLAMCYCPIIFLIRERHCKSF